MKLKNTDFEQLREEVYRLQRSKRYLNHLLLKQEILFQELVDLERKVDEEIEDIEFLKRASLQNTFLKILGKQAQQYAIEKQEYLQAILNYRRCRKVLDLLAYEINVLQKVIADKAHLEQLFLHKTDRFNRLPGDISPASVIQIKKIKQEIEEVSLHKIELEEALEVGNKLLSHLKEVEILLSQIKDWGADTNGTQYDLIDEAQEKCYVVEQDLIKFEKELQDVLKFLKIRIEDTLSRMLGFNSIHFENLISDWIIHRKIVNGKAFIASLHDRIFRIVSALYPELQKREEIYQELEAEYSKLMLKLSDGGLS